MRQWTSFYGASELGLEAQGSEELRDADREVRQDAAEIDAVVGAQNARCLILDKARNRAIGGVDEQCGVHPVLDVPQAPTHQRVGALFGRDNLDGHVGGSPKDIVDVAIDSSRDAVPSEDRDVGHVGGAAEHHAKLRKGQSEAATFGEAIDPLTEGELQAAVLSLGRHLLDDRPVRFELEGWLFVGQRKKLVEGESLGNSHGSGALGLP